MIQTNYHPSKIVDKITSSIDGNEMIDDDRVGRMEKRMKPLRDVGKLHFHAVENLHQIPIAVDHFSLMRILRKLQ